MGVIGTDGTSVDEEVNVAPPPFLIGGDDNISDKTKDQDCEQKANLEDLETTAVQEKEIGIGIFGDVESAPNANDDSDIETDIDERVVLGPIRPTHVREALRS